MEENKGGSRVTRKEDKTITHPIHPLTRKVGAVEAHDGLGDVVPMHRDVRRVAEGLHVALKVRDEEREREMR